VYQVKDGWGPLCEFLDLPVPTTDFPRVNSRETTRQLLSKMMSGGSEGPDDQAMSEAAGELFREAGD
jgi:hypothetical protein